jgi:hypothetical protein
MIRYNYCAIMATALITLTLLIGCNSTSKEKKNNNAKITNGENKHLNLNIFLDLSDRIDPKRNHSEAMEIYQRDLGYIKSLAEAFENHVNETKINSMHETLQLFFEPEPKSPEINALAKKMKFIFDKSTVTPKLISSITPQYVSSSQKIYQVALKENKYIGADIWNFFKNKVKDQCISPERRNVLIIITDGYMYHEENQLRVGNQTSYLTPALIRAARLNESRFSEKMDKDKFGFLPATSGLQNLEVLVLGINPEKGKPFEEDVIKKYWGDWLQNMGVSKYQIKGTDLPTYMDNIIKKTLSIK